MILMFHDDNNLTHLQLYHHLITVVIYNDLYDPFVNVVVEVAAAVDHLRPDDPDDRLLLPDLVVAVVLDLLLHHDHLDSDFDCRH